MNCGLDVVGVEVRRWRQLCIARAITQYLLSRPRNGTAERNWRGSGRWTQSYFSSAFARAQKILPICAFKHWQDMQHTPTASSSTDALAAAPFLNQPPPPFAAAALPDIVLSSEVCRAAYNLAAQSLRRPIFNHSLRVFAHALRLAAGESAESIIPEKIHILFTACVLHDLGTSTSYDGHQRFEVEGADGAANFLTSFHVDANDVREVWMAIALHTSPHIAERISPLSRYVRLAVLVDFGRSAREAVFKENLERQWPRLDIERCLADAVVEQAVRQPEKAPPASWPGALYRSHVEDPHWTGTNKSF